MNASNAPSNAWTTFAALGVVFGDLGTSPLYALQTVVADSGGHLNEAAALGVLSLIFWALVLVVSIKYCAFVMRADNHGEGGILALMSLIGTTRLERGMRVFAIMGLLGAALIYGDGVITPAISVLSALEGLNVVTSAFKPFVMPIAVGILIALFATQRFGTERIGRAFGPIMSVWFMAIATLGVHAILAHPRVLLAIDPRFAIDYLIHVRSGALAILGGVFLCVTGGEALYADMGHFGAKPIRCAWYLLVLPSLLLSYAGQTAYILDHAASGGNPFFLSAPSWVLYPLVILSTLATIIASQAIITGSFSMTRQAMQLGWLPGVSIRQTSDRVYGQIYVPVVNWLLMMATVLTTIAFGSSDRLAGAYGTAVSMTMLLTSVLLFKAMRDVWRWPTLAVVAVTIFFMLEDGAFFIANLAKIREGGWLPLSIAGSLFLVMVTWRAGVDSVRAALVHAPEKAEDFLRKVHRGGIPRVEGTTVFLTRSSQRVSRLIMDHARFTGVLPRHAVALSVIFEEVPRVRERRCSEVERVGEGLWHVSVRFGFFEVPDLRAALREARCADRTLDFERAIFVGTRDLVVAGEGARGMQPWRVVLFAFLYRNSVKLVDRFNLPAEHVVEIARQIEI